MSQLPHQLQFSCFQSNVNGSHEVQKCFNGTHVSHVLSDDKQVNHPVVIASANLSIVVNNAKQLSQVTACLSHAGTNTCQRCSSSGKKWPVMEAKLSKTNSQSVKLVEFSKLCKNCKNHTDSYYLIPIFH